MINKIDENNSSLGTYIIIGVPIDDNHELDYIIDHNLNIQEWDKLYTLSFDSKVKEDSDNIYIYNVYIDKESIETLIVDENAGKNFEFEWNGYKYKLYISDKIISTNRDYIYKAILK
jgi:hypothetical protein